MYLSRLYTCNDLIDHATLPKILNHYWLDSASRDRLNHLNQV